MKVVIISLISLLVIHQIFVKILISKTVKNTKRLVNEFKKVNYNIKPLPLEIHNTISIFQEYITNKERQRINEIEELSETKIKRPKISLKLSEIDEAQIDNKEIFMTVMRQTCKHRIKQAFRSSLKDRLLREKVIKNSIDDTTTASILLNDNNFHNTLESIKENIEPKLSLIEDEIMRKFDELGLMDATVDIINGSKDVIGENATNEIIEMADFASYLDSFPHTTSLISDATREIDLLWNNETTVQDAALNAGVSFGIKLGSIKIGMALDAMTLGVSCGAFTLLCKFAGKKLYNGILEEENKGLNKEYQELSKELKLHYDKSKKEIEKKANSFDKKYKLYVNSYPDINNETNMISYLKSIKNTFNDGIKELSKKLSYNTALTLSTLPKKNWIDYLLLIDRPSIVKKMYLQIQREITSKQVSLSASFSISLNKSPKDAFNFLKDFGFLNTEIFHENLMKIQSVVLKCEENYSKEVELWRKSLNEFNRIEGARVADKMNEIAIEYNDYKSDKKIIMKRLHDKININRKRAGLKVNSWN